METTQKLLGLDVIHEKSVEESLQRVRMPNHRNRLDQVKGPQDLHDLVCLGRWMADLRPATATLQTRESED